MAVPLSYVNWTFLDNTVNVNTGQPESASFELGILTLTAGNLVATNVLIGDLTSAIEAVAIGNLGKLAVTLDRQVLSSTPAPSTLAQRGVKLLCRYHDATIPAKKFRFSIPTFDLTLLTSGDEFLDLTAGVGADLKTAFEAVVRSPDDVSHSVILDSAQYVD